MLNYSESIITSSFHLVWKYCCANSETWQLEKSEGTMGAGIGKYVSAMNKSCFGFPNKPSGALFAARRSCSCYKLVPERPVLQSRGLSFCSVCF